MKNEKEQIKKMTMSTTRSWQTSSDSNVTPDLSFDIPKVLLCENLINYFFNKFHIFISNINMASKPAPKIIPLVVFP